MKCLLAFEADTEFRSAVEQGVDMDRAALLFTEQPLAADDRVRGSFVGSIPENFERLDRQYLADNLNSYGSDSISPGVLFQILNNGETVVVGISTDHRLFAEDWIKIEKDSGIGHALEVIDMGMGVDPFDDQRKPYFLIRDSFVNDKIHFKVAVENFMPYVRHLWHVGDVKQIKQDDERGKEAN